MQSDKSSYRDRIQQHSCTQNQQINDSSCFKNERSQSMGLKLESRYMNSNERSKSRNLQNSFQGLTEIIDKMPVIGEQKQKKVEGKQNMIVRKKISLQTSYRDLKVLQRKRKTNYKLLNDQTKELLSLNYLNLLIEQIKICKSLIIQKKINHHRQKIKNRSYARRHIENIKSEAKNYTINQSKSISKISQIHQQQVQNSFSNKMKLLSAQKDLLKAHIAQKKRHNTTNQDLLKKQNDIIKRQIQLIVTLTRSKSKSLVIAEKQMYNSKISLNKKSLSMYDCEYKQQIKRCNRKKLINPHRSRSPVYKNKIESPYFNL